MYAYFFCNSAGKYPCLLAFSNACIFISIDMFSSHLKQLLVCRVPIFVGESQSE